MPDINALSQLYPQPQPPNQNFMAGDPGKMLQILPGLADFGAKQAVGNALQQSTDPQGNVDIGGFQSRAAQNPTAALRMMEAVNFGQQQKAQQFELAQAQREQVGKLVAAYGSRNDATIAGITDFIVRLPRTGMDPRIVHEYSDVLKGAVGKPDELRKILSDINLTYGSPTTTSIAEGPVNPQTGQRPQMTGAQVVRQAQGGGGPGAPGYTGMPPGYNEAATGLAVGGARQADALMVVNDTSMIRKGMLGNLEEDLHHFTSGAGAEWEKVGKAWINRNLPLPPNWKFDPQSIASQEQFAKQAGQLAQAQFQAIGGSGTDAKFSSAFETSPNEALSQLGNKGIIRLLKGNEDAIQAKSHAWQSWLDAGNGPNSYPKFSQSFNQRFDPRVFQFKYLPQKERQDYINRMDPADRQRFWGDLTYAHKVGWIPYDVPAR